MDYERAYKDLFGIVSELYPSMNEYQKEKLSESFPNLMESDYEKIRKEIINYFKSQSRDEPSKKHIHDKWITWLKNRKIPKVPLDENREPILNEFEGALFTTISYFWQAYAFGENVDIAEFAKEHAPSLLKEAKRYQHEIVEGRPAFEVGETITDGTSTFTIVGIEDEHYVADDGDKVPFYVVHKYYTPFKEIKCTDSESEKIKEELLTYLQHELHVDKTIKCDKYNKFVAWVEKQGEQSIEEIENPSVRKYMELDKFALANMLAERDKNSAETIKAFDELEKQGEQKNVDITNSKDRGKELSLSLQIQTYLNTASDELYAKGKPLYSEKRIEDIHKCMKMWTKLHNAYFYGNSEQKIVEWSEEDEHRRTDAIYFLEDAKKHYASVSEIDATINWLKGLCV